MPPLRWRRPFTRQTGDALADPGSDDGLPVAAILAALRDAAAIVDGSGRVSGWNAAAVARFGLAPDAVAGRPLHDLGLPQSPDPSILVRLPLGDGADGGVLHVWRPERDILPPEALELQKADALGRLAGPVAHELAQPLAAIQSLASAIEFDPGVPEDLRDTASLLRGEADRTLRMVRSLLEVVRRRPPVSGPVALEPVVRGILELEAGMLISVETQLSIPEALPAVLADPAALRQVILALTMNAISAMGGDASRGRLGVAAEVVEDSEVGRTVVRLLFEDSAPVIPAGRRADLFTTVRGDDPAARPTMDLAVAARLVALDGGRLWYEPLADGNRFVVELQSALDVEATTRDRADREPGSPSVASPSDLPAATPALTVLVCDDEATIRALVVRKLQLTGIASIEASSGEEALALLAERGADAVLADHRMAAMSGLELYERVVAMRPDLAARFILMSGDPGDAELTAFATSAGLRILAKPFDLAVLAATVRATAGA